MCFVCDENLHINKMKHVFNESVSFTNFIKVCQVLSRLSTNFTDNPRTGIIIQSLNEKRPV